MERNDVGISEMYETTIEVIEDVTHLKEND